MSTNFIVRPIITEKALKEADRGNYTFEVAASAAKPAIRRAFKDAFGVDVVSIKTLIIKGRTNRVWGRRQRAKASPIKKAMVTLAKGQKLDVFEIKAS